MEIDRKKSILDVEVIVDTGIPTYDPAHVFDTRDFISEEVDDSDVKQELFEFLNQCSSMRSTKHVVVLKNPIGSFSISDIFNMSISIAKQIYLQSVQFIVFSEESKEYLTNGLPPINPLRKVLTFENHEIILAMGDITEIVVDAIVNASNPRLKLGAGVSEAISSKAGPGLQAELQTIAKKKTIVSGDAVITGSHQMSTCQYIIHAATVDGTAETIRRAFRNCLKLCLERKIESVAFPALGTGTGGLSQKICANILTEELKRWYKRSNLSDTFPKKLYLILWTKGGFSIFLSVMNSAFFYQGTKSH